MFHFSVLQFCLKNGQKKKENDNFLRKKAEEKQNSATAMISVDGKGQFSSEGEITRGIVWKNILRKGISKKV